MSVFVKCSVVFSALCFDERFFVADGGGGGVFLLAGGPDLHHLVLELGERIERVGLVEHEVIQQSEHDED